MTNNNEPDQKSEPWPLQRLFDLVNAVMRRENLSLESKADLGFVKFYAKELTAKCKNCADGGSGSKNDSVS